MIQLNCKTCGASLDLDLTKPKIICEYCRAEYLVEQLLTERRINDIDSYNKLEPVAHNYYNLHNYKSAIKAYEKLIQYRQTQIDIARYNLCCLALDIIKPSEELFKNLECLEPKEKYEQIKYIKDMAYNITKEQANQAIHNYSGIHRLKVMYSLSKWYKPYRKMMDEVIPLECSCGKVISKGENSCKCGIERRELLEYKRRRKRAFRFAVVLSICTIITLGVKFIFYHTL